MLPCRLAPQFYETLRHGHGAGNDADSIGFEKTSNFGLGAQSSDITTSRVQDSILFCYELNDRATIAVWHSYLIEARVVSV